MVKKSNERVYQYLNKSSREYPDQNWYSLPMYMTSWSVVVVVVVIVVVGKGWGGKTSLQVHLSSPCACSCLQSLGQNFHYILCVLDLQVLREFGSLQGIMRG